MKAETADLGQLVAVFLSSREDLLSHHLASFNVFLGSELNKIMQAEFNKTIESEFLKGFSARYLRVTVERPMIDENFARRRLLPWECRQRGLTYSGRLTADVEFRYAPPDGDAALGFAATVVGLPMGRMPVMLGSDHCWLRDAATAAQLAALRECEFDPCGYFIVRGAEKVVLMQEQLCRNKVLLETDKSGFPAAVCASATLETKSKVTIIFKANQLWLRSNSFREPIPLLIILRALDAGSDRALAALLWPFLQTPSARAAAQFNCALSACFHSLVAARIVTASEAVAFLAARVVYAFKSERVRSAEEREREARAVLARTILPHIPARNGDFRAKRDFLAWMARRLLRAQFGGESGDIRNNKDYLGNKRIESAAEMLGLVFEDLVKRFNGEVRKEMDKGFERWRRADAAQFAEFRASLSVWAARVFASELITNGLNHAISSGNWSIRRFKVSRQGVTQMLNRMNHIGALGMLTRFESHVEKTRKVAGPRSLQCSHFGYVCPVDTPDGSSCGLVKNLALLARVSVNIDESAALSALRRFGVADGVGNWTVLLNGRLIGNAVCANTLLRHFRRARAEGRVEPFVSAFADEGELVVDVWTDAGRLLRPLIVVSALRANWPILAPHFARLGDQLAALAKHGLLSKSDELIAPRNALSELRKLLISSGTVEYLDANELNNCEIALSMHEATAATTHVEVSPAAVTGLLASSVPFLHHNQSPRNTYQCAMVKQALGLPATNLAQRSDNAEHTLVYPQRPLVDSLPLSLACFHRLPAGQNAVLAVLSLSGYDIEDAVLLNAASIERGFGRVILARKQVFELEGAGMGNVGERLAASASLPDGIAEVGARVVKEDILISRVSPAIAGGEPVPRPIRYIGKTPSRVQSVTLTHSADKYLVARIMLAQVRTPEVGDKFSSRHGQKGVAGLLIPQTDMPFTERGIIPDIVMNPHGFPSRMTIGKLLEVITGKRAALEGRIHSATAFDDKKPCLQCATPCKCADVAESAGRALLAHGFEYGGTEVFYSGSSGTPLRGQIFSGPVYYQRLKHMVADKIHARAAGKKAFLTRQPLEGRAKEGGLRLGEMERDCLVGFGASSILIERFLLASDAEFFKVCDGCRAIGCDGRCSDGEPHALRQIRLPYPAKLLFQELIAMGIRTRINVRCS